MNFPAYYDVRDSIKRFLRLEIQPDWNDRLNHRVEWDGWAFFQKERFLSRAIDQVFHLWLNKDEPFKWIKNKRWHRRALRRLDQARVLTYGTYCYEAEGTPQIDGYLDIEYAPGKTDRIGLDIASIGDARYWAEEEWRRGQVQVGGYYTYFGDQVAVVPFDGITSEIAKEAVIRWYMSRYEWRRGHWTFKEKKLPEFRFDMHFEPVIERSPEAAESHAKYLERLRQLDNQREIEFNGRYGRVVEQLTNREDAPSLDPSRTAFLDGSPQIRQIYTGS